MDTAQLSEIIALETLFFIFGILVFFDTLTGVIKAWKNGRLKSRTLRDGMFASLGEIVLMACCILINYCIPLTGTVMFLCFLWLCVKEFYSILENLVEIGVQPPKFLVKGLKAWLDRTENIEKKEKGNKNEGSN